jgi:carbonic anhydrase
MLKARVRPWYVIFPAVMVSLLFSIVLTASAHENSASPDGLALLIEGNQRFMEGRLKAKDYLAERPQLAQSQHPFAIILTCSDSRLSPEIIFDESQGRLFVIRTAGHVVDPVSLGSIEYAVEHLHVKLLLVLGHDSCGAVTATISGGEVTPNIRVLLAKIKPAVDKAMSKGLAEKDLLDAAIAENVRYQMQRSIFESDLLSESVLKRKLAIVGGVYHLKDGRVELIPAYLGVEQIKGEPSKITSDNRAIGKDHSETVGAASDHAKPTETVPPQTKGTSFADSIRAAYAKNRNVQLKKTMLMRDDRDRCATDDCRGIPAGELVSLESPLILNVMDRRQLKVRYKGHSYYILADAEALEFTNN